MFTVYHKLTGEPTLVYDVAYDRNGYAHFLVYRNKEWVRLSAKHFSPKPNWTIGGCFDEFD